MDGPKGPPIGALRLPRQLSQSRAAYILLAPLLIFFGISVVYPVVETIRLSFFEIKGLAPPKAVGLGNYLKLFYDENFMRALRVTFYWSFSATFFSVIIGWALAMACALKPRETMVFRVLIFAAYGVSEAVVGFIWLGIYRPDYGLLNGILGGMGLEHLQQAWLGNPATALTAVIVAYVWTQVGLPLMMCFASIQSIPRTYFEAAYIDGAKPMSMMRHIVMPLSLPGVRVAIFINLLQSLKAFDLIYMLTGGGPVRTTETVGFFMFRESMLNFKLGYGAASTVVLLVAVLIVSIPLIAQRTRAVK
ncbi:sugar ABC transporter permease [Phaeobacter sp. J2-8]|uniref:carbohydrate ABC transporter permease n=1 Tax=Phaeobacter sp. J2-8 TaxID=2931394 RepID=UPI001FD41D52|nr:sugar ABC transporter permease [Phaeobacter sp. J2-8]